MQHILDVQLPEEKAAGAPGGDFQRIDSNPDMFGGFGAKAKQAYGQGLENLGGGIVKAGDTGIDIATQQAQMDAKTHANEVHSWQSDQVTNAQEEFLKLRGKDAEMALPDFKKQIDDFHTQARSQAGSPYAAQMVDAEGRRLTDVAYSQAARHAAQQKTTWDTGTAVDSAASAGSRAALGAATTPNFAEINANPSVVVNLLKSDDFARQAAQFKGLDGDIEVQKNRGKNVGEIIKSTLADGSQTSLQRAIKFFHSQYDQIDPGARATIEQALKGQAASYDGQKTADIYMGRGANLPPGYVQRTFQVESGGNPNAQSGSHGGLGQFSPMLEARYGINDANRTDPATQARALSQENAENHDALARTLGHEPTPADYYLAHQQGVGGAVAHLTQPNLPAWQNMFATVEGREKGQGWAKQAIWGNMTPDMKAQFPGGVESVTSGDFARMWAQRFYNQPVQAIGTVPGAGFPAQPGQPVAFGFNRFQAAQDFNDQNKGDVIKRITNDPYLLDHPLAMNAAITYTHKIFEAQNANYADAERALHVQEQQKKLISEDAENNYLKQIYAPTPNAKPLNTQDIVLDDRLSRESKDRLIKLTTASEEKDDKTYGAGFTHAMQMVHAPAGTSGRITDSDQLWNRLGPAGDLTYAGATKLRDEINLKKSPEGNAESEMKKNFFEYAKSHISGEDLGMKMSDPKGSENYMKFLQYALPAYDAGRKEGKTPMQLLNPESPDYVGKSISSFTRPMNVWFGDMITDQPAQGTKPAEPAFDISKVASQADLVAAYRDGKVTPQQARDYAVQKGWASRKAAPPAVPVSRDNSANLLEQARAQYPILKKQNYGYVENFKPNSGFLEHWDPGEPGSPSSPEKPLDGMRPSELPLDQHGLEIRDPKTRPIDILGDIVSHNLVHTDPVVKAAYEKLQSSLTPAQQDILKDQYGHAKKNDGETRSFDDWKAASGMPAFFRGYTFQQWPKEFNDKAYTHEQRADLDKLMDYLKGSAKP